MSSQEFWCQTRGKKTHCADGVGFPDPRDYGTWIDFRSLYSKPYPEQDATGSLAYRFTTKLFGALKSCLPLGLRGQRNNFFKLYLLLLDR